MPPDNKLGQYRAYGPNCGASIQFHRRSVPLVWFLHRKDDDLTFDVMFTKLRDLGHQHMGPNFTFPGMNLYIFSKIDTNSVI